MRGRLTVARFRSLASRIKANLRTRARHAVLAANPAAFARAPGQPADFSAWAARQATQRQPPVPDDWQRAPAWARGEGPRICVVIHVYYPELLDDLLQRLKAIPVAYDLIVTNASGVSLSIDPSRLPRVNEIRVLGVENRGRDLWPLGQVVNAGLLDGYLLVLKLHTKRSRWRDDHGRLPGTGSDWRTTLLDSLLGDESNVIAILDAFARSPRLGQVTADESVLGPEFWGGDEAITADLLRRLEMRLHFDDLWFAAGSMYWSRGFILQGLRALRLSADDFEDEAGQIDATTAHALERLIGIVTAEAGLAVQGRSSVPTFPSATRSTGWGRFQPDVALRPRARVVPFYLPQFHPIPENDRWWGAGFTEWSNVAAARPFYPGHQQPKLPTVTGFYDLRLPETVALQIQLARWAGVESFMYYHYWFGGKALLGGPLTSRLGDDHPIGFCLMWANENWTRRWDGRDDDILIGQRYRDVPSSSFIQDALPILRDRRYFKIGGRKVIAIYRPAQIPDIAETLAAWRQIARDEGLGELCILSADVVREFDGLEGDPTSSGLDGKLGFPPHNARWEWLAHQEVGALPGFSGNILDYRSMADDSMRRFARDLSPSYFPGVMVAFDNTARRPSSPDVWFGANPYTFRRWLAAAVAAIADRPVDERVVFVNAWNEWAEGAVLEPTAAHGTTYLSAVRDVVLS